MLKAYLNNVNRVKDQLHTMRNQQIACHLEAEVEFGVTALLTYGIDQSLNSIEVDAGHESRKTDPAIFQGALDFVF